MHLEEVVELQAALRNCPVDCGDLIRKEEESKCSKHEIHHESCSWGDVHCFGRMEVELEGKEYRILE